MALLIKTDSKTLPRRTLLRGTVGGAGLAVALPMLDIMRPARGQPAAPKRFIAMEIPNGLSADRAQRFGPSTFIDPWTPQNTGPTWRPAEVSAPYNALRSHLTLVSGVHQTVFPPNIMDHASNAMHLCPYTPVMTGQYEFQATSRSMDQIIADRIGGTAPFKSLEVGSYLITNVSNIGNKYLSWDGARSPRTVLDNPTVLFDRLFATPPAGGNQALERLRAERRSVLDGVKAQMDAIGKRLGRGDKTRVDLYATNLREVEKRLLADQFIPGAGCQVPARPTINHRDPNLMQQVVELQFDLIKMAMTCDLTRVATYMLCGGISDAVYPFLGTGTTGHHEMTHGGANAATLHKIDLFHNQLAATLIDKFQKEPDGASTLLDNTTIMIFGDVASGGHHNNGGWTWRGMTNGGGGGQGTTNGLLDWGYVLAGGTHYFKHGSHIRYQPGRVLYERVLMAVFESVTGLSGIGAQVFLPPGSNVAPAPGFKGDMDATLMYNFPT